MANRICSFCNAGYTDEEGHDYDKCVATLETRLENAGKFLNDTQRALDEAIVARNRRHELHRYCDMNISRLKSHIEQARKNLAELDDIASKAIGPSYAMDTNRLLESRLDGVREAIRAFEDAAKGKLFTDCFCDGLPECNCK